MGTSAIYSFLYNNNSQTHEINYYDHYDGYESGAASKIAMAVDAMYNYNSDRLSIIETNRGGISHAAMRGNSTFELSMDTLENSRKRNDCEYYYEITNNNLEWQVDVLSSDRFIHSYKLVDFINKYADEDLHVCEVPIQHKFWSKEQKYLLPIKRLDSFIEKAYEEFARFNDGNPNKENAEITLNALLETKKALEFEKSSSLKT